MKILLIGNTGQLGWELNRTLLPLGEVKGVDYPEIDMANANSIIQQMRSFRPDMVINASAYTNVDKAESEEALATAINATGPGILAEESKKQKAILIHYSTDYVFDGLKGTLYEEDDVTHPLGVYGSSKRKGELAVAKSRGTHLIFRTSWVYSTRRSSFVSKVIEWASKSDTLKIVDDQIANPTWSRALAETTALLISRFSISELHDRAGLYHLAGRGYCSRFEWAREILFLADRADEVVVAGKTSEFPTPAERPLFSALDCSLFRERFGLELPNWKNALRLAMDDKTFN